ncbi:alginate lyase family protein [Actinoallomurus sp. NPDC050550]|uniref:alginate lyase family protein n=1 Tax=Actinoallomurus sp. NPDC050550 TaxID=3154937 RepID=UPI0033DDC805
MSESSRRQFLKITAVGAGATALSGAGIPLTASPAGAVTSGITSFTHPGVLHNLTDLQRIRTNVKNGVEPWLSGWNAFKSDAYSQSTYAKAGPYTTVSRGTEGYTGWDALWMDANAAYQNAIMWYVTLDTTHASKALEIIKAWTNTLTSIKGSEAVLASSIAGAKLAAACEIMRYTKPSGAWTSTEVNTTVAMFKNIFVPLISNYWEATWGVMCIRGMCQMGVFCDDISIFDSAYNAFYTHACCSLGKMILPSGQSLDTGRDQQHAQLALGAFAEVCQTAWIQGRDLYAASDHRLLKAFEYTASYNLGNSVPYTTQTSCSVTYTSNSSLYRGQLRPIYEMAWNHYVKRADAAAPYSYEAILKIRPEGAAFQADHPGFGTLLFTL